MTGARSRWIVFLIGLALPGGASNDLVPDLQHPENPVPLVDPTKPINVKAAGD